MAEMDELVRRFECGKFGLSRARDEFKKYADVLLNYIDSELASGDNTPQRANRIFYSDAAYLRDKLEALGSYLNDYVMAREAFRSAGGIVVDKHEDR